MKQASILLAVCSLVSGSYAAAKAVAVLPSGEKCVAGQVLVQLNAGLRGRLQVADAGFGVPRLDELCRQEGVTAVERVVRNPNPSSVVLSSGADLLFLLSMAPDVDVARVVGEFKQLPDVAGAWPNAVLDVCGADETPNDPGYGGQWYLPRIRAPRAWDIAHGDSSVIIAVLDDGVEWVHEDIQANIWINTAEDLNGNGRFDSLWYPDGDLDGIDQDGNGYTDDVIGFDFVGGDPNPEPEGSDDHGTLCWGIANAVTDNGVGIAAPPWNVRAMGLRCGSGGNINVAAVVSAINYALDKGARVFSMSFGSLTPYPPLDNACQAIWTAGALSVAAAAGVPDSTYPAAFANVVAVAASDRDDKRAPFSGYGDWIDVCAPGVDLLSTTPPGYDSVNGTSYATAVVAGVLAWFKSAYLDISNDSALALLYNYCDSMPDSLYRVGLLGHGRVAMTDSAVGGVTGRKPLTGPSACPSIVRGALLLPRDMTELPGNSDRVPRPALLDVTGQKVMELTTGANGVSALPPGVYFVRQASGVGREASSVHKIVVAR